MRTRITKKGFGRSYVLAASIKVSDGKNYLWLNPNKTEAKRKTLADLWKN